MVKSTGFRWGGTETPSDGVFKYDPKNKTFFPTSFKQKGGNVKASAGPFSFKTDASTENKFTWTPLSAELKVGASFGLAVSTKLAVNPVGMGISWTPGLPAGIGLLAGTAAALLAMPALLVGMIAMSSGKSENKNMIDMANYVGLVSAALALVAIQQNITFKMNLPLATSFTLHPLLTVSKEEGEKASFTALESENQIVAKKNNLSKTWAALGVVRSTGAKTDANVGDVGANAVQAKVSGVDNVT